VVKAKRRNISAPLSVVAVRFTLYCATSFGKAQQSFWSGAAALSKVHGCGSASRKRPASAGGARESTQTACVIAAGTGSTERASRLIGGSHVVPVRAAGEVAVSTERTSRATGRGAGGAALQRGRCRVPLCARSQCRLRCGVAGVGRWRLEVWRLHLVPCPHARRWEGHSGSGY
jgi:hypothetical protein